MMSKYGNAIAKQKAKVIQNCTNDFNLCFKAAALLTLTRNIDKYWILDCENIDERLQITNTLLKNELELFKGNQTN